MPSSHIRKRTSKGKAPSADNLDAFRYIETGWCPTTAVEAMCDTTTDQELAEAKALHARRDTEERLGRTPQGKQFFHKANQDLRRLDYAAAISNLQMALTFDREVEGQVLTFEAVEGDGFPFRLRDRETGSLWTLDGQAVEGELAGSRIEPRRTFSAMWFAWAAFNRGTEIFSPS